MEWGAAASLLKIVAAGAVALPLALWFLQERLIFFPQPIPEARRAEIVQSFLGVESVFLEAADGTRLHAWHVKAQAPDAPLVLYFGGNAEEVSWMIPRVRREAPQAGWLLVDYRGYGSSGGSPSQKALVSDALLWHDYATKRSTRLFVLGRSLGSGTAVPLAAERPVQGVILIAPFDSLVALGRRHYPFLPVRWMLKHPFDSVALAPSIAAPLLCVVAERDEIIPVVHSQRLYEAWGGAKRWVMLPGAGHNNTDDAPELWSAIRGFLEKKS